MHWDPSTAPASSTLRPRLGSCVSESPSEVSVPNLHLGSQGPNAVV